MKAPGTRVLVKVFCGALFCMLFALQVRIWVSEDGFSEVARLHDQVALQRHENEQLADRNERLDAEVKDLKRGFAAVEERARSDLGLISPGESFYVFGDPGAGSDDATASD